MEEPKKKGLTIEELEAILIEAGRHSPKTVTPQRSPTGDTPVETIAERLRRFFSFD